jgi:hypothetical protein
MLLTVLLDSGPHPKSPTVAILKLLGVLPEARTPVLLAFAIVPVLLAFAIVPVLLAFAIVPVLLVGKVRFPGD